MTIHFLADILNLKQCKKIFETGGKMEMLIQRMLELFLLYIPLVIVAVIILSIAKKVAVQKNINNKFQNLSKVQIFFSALFCAYIFMVIYMTLMNNMYMSAGAGGVNLIPFNDISFPIGKMQLYGILANIALFVPFGFLYNLVFKRSLKKPFAISVLMSFTIEVVQLFIGRTCDIDDFIFNTLGALLGLLLYFVCYAVYRKVKK